MQQNVIAVNGAAGTVGVSTGASSKAKKKKNKKLKKARIGIISNGSLSRSHPNVNQNDAHSKPLANGLSNKVKSENPQIDPYTPAFNWTQSLRRQGTNLQKGGPPMSFKRPSSQTNLERQNSSVKAKKPPLDRRPSVLEVASVDDPMDIERTELV